MVGMSRWLARGNRVLQQIEDARFTPFRTREAAHPYPKRRFREQLPRVGMSRWLIRRTGCRIEIRPRTCEAANLPVHRADTCQDGQA